MRTRIKSRWALSILFVSLMATLTVGCGSSRDEFIVEPPIDPNRGELVFLFDRPEAVGRSTVPSTTESLRFDFFSTNTPSQVSLEFSELRTYRDEVRFQVPASIRSVVVTALNLEGEPQAVYFGQFTVQLQQSIEVELNPVEDADLFVTAAPTTLVEGLNVIAYSGLYISELTDVEFELTKEEMTYSLVSGPEGTAVAENGDITVPVGGEGQVVVEVSFNLEGDDFSDLVTFTILADEPNGKEGNAGTGGNV